MQTQQKIQFLQSFVNQCVNKPGLSSAILKNLQIISVEKNLVRFRMPISQVHLNSYDKLHGGVTCTLVDFGGSLVAASHLNSMNTGVSTDLSVSFTNTAQLGDILEMESRLLRSGKTLAFTETKIYTSSSSSSSPFSDRGITTEALTLIGFGSHTKFIGKAVASLGDENTMAGSRL